MKIGIALGSGSARGWAHLGVLKSLSELGIKPDIVTGASAGALVAAAYASECLGELEEWALSLSRTDIWRLLDATFGGRGGIIKGDRLMRAIAETVPEQNIEELGIPFASVAADLLTGTEIWIREGSLHQAIRASSGLPGLFAPVRHKERWLIDGGVVNPVPVSLCRALGADFVIAVNLNHHLSTRSLRATKKTAQEESEKQTDSKNGQENTAGKWTEMLNSFLTSHRESKAIDEPSMVETMTATINIMQNRITRSRMVGDPPDATIAPNLSDFQLMDFHLAAEAISEGRSAVNRALPELEILMP